ncbi:MAG: hypothetical protein IPH44_22570 [Myxococcales bacterium]|nr:hypothetical protein [Myxococcales bacterium]
MSATPAKPANPPALRLGIVLSGTVVAEQIVRDQRPFSIGQSARASIQLPLPTLPRNWELLTITPAGIRLRLAPGMDARIAVGDAVWTRAECDAHGKVAAGATTVVLPLAAHGRVDVGEVRVLFQGVRLPAPAPAPTLPRALKGTLADRIDGRVAAFAAASLVAHLGVMIAANLNDPPGEADDGAPRDRDVHRRHDRADRRQRSDLRHRSDARARARHPAGADQARAHRADADPQADPNTGRPAAPTPSVTEPGDPTRMADLLFAPDGDTGRTVGDLSAKKPGTDLAQQLDEIKRNDQTASIGDQTGRVRPDDAYRPGTSQNPVVDPGTRPVTPIDKGAETGPPGRIKPVPTPRPPGDPSVDGIIRKISTTYMPSLQRCYKKSLVGDGTLAGKVSLTFTVTDRGALTDGNAAGVDDNLASCVEGVMAKWSFTPVIDGDGDPTDVDVKLGLVLTPK